MSAASTVRTDGPRLDARALARGEQPPDAPFRVTLEASRRGEAGVPTRVAAVGASSLIEVTCDRVLRVLAGSRLVAMARLEGRPVLLKLFVGKGAARRARREATGSRLLTSAGVATPRLLAAGPTPDGEGHGLLFEWLPDVGPLDPADTGAVVTAATALARLHAAGVLHTDLHLGNFLCSPDPDRPVHLVDPGAVRRGYGLLPGAAGIGRRASVANLAVLCAQRPPALDVALADVHSAYVRARGWGPGAAGFGLAELQRAVRRARALRVRQYLRKTTRACSEYHVERAGGVARICVRALRGAGLQQFLREPEALFGTGTMVKDGNSATVVRLVIDGRSWIVKRYNVKNAWHGLRRALKPNARHRNAWRNGQRLHFLGIPTARPVALLERRVGPFPGTAYLVMEDLGARDLLGEGRAGRIDATLLNRVVELFALLRTLGITHGDTKATNFIVQDSGSALAGHGRHERSVALIDLDSMHASARGCARDRARFLENWRGEPELAQRFRDAFRAAGLDAGSD